MTADRRESGFDELPVSWQQPSNAYGWRMVAANALPYFLLLALAPLLARRRFVSPWWLSPLVGLFAYRLTIVMHDCIHRTLFEDRALNVSVGKALGAVTGIDFTRFSRQHLRHHRHVGEAEADPQGFHYLDLATRSGREKLWHVLKPLLGFNVGHAWPESIAHPRNFARALRSGDALLFVGAQLCVAALVSGGGRYLTLALLPALSAGTFGLFLSQLRGIAEHAATSGEQRGYVRTHAPSLLERALLYGLNFNYHAEHHRYPGIPSRHLADVQRAGNAEAPPQDATMLRTLGEILCNPAD